MKNTFPVEALILAGGKGTRLKEVIDNIPKPMAPVNGKPFLWHLMTHLAEQGIKHIVLSVGYKNEVIKNYFGDEFNGLKISYVVEKEPLGTGGAIKLAMNAIENPNFWVINGDTFVDIDLKDFYKKSKNKDISLALKEMKNFDRYGIVETDENKITAFKEKEYRKSGLINAGIYLMSKKFVNNFSPAGNRFSFEKDILEQVLEKTELGYYTTDSTFIDIGIPEDYFKSQYIFSNGLNKAKLFSLDSSWTIFLDRDGVINHRRPGSYVKDIEDFEFINGSIEAIVKLSKHFHKIVVVTNQQGLGKGLMTEAELKTVNDYMVSKIEEAGGRIDGVYYCPKLITEKPNCRKPEPYMAYSAQKDFPDIEFQKSIIIGDSISDMNFGKNLGMKTILIPMKEEEKYQYPKIEVDWRIKKLSDIN